MDGEAILVATVAVDLAWDGAADPAAVADALLDHEAVSTARVAASGARCVYRVDVPAGADGAERHERALDPARDVARALGLGLGHADVRVRAAGAPEDEDPPDA